MTIRFFFYRQLIKDTNNYVDVEWQLPFIPRPGDRIDSGVFKPFVNAEWLEAIDKELESDRSCIVDYINWDGVKNDFYDPPISIILKDLGK